MIALKDRFAGKVTVVRGAAPGIGRAISERLPAEGAKVVGSDLKPCDITGELISIEREVTQEGTAEALVTIALECFGSVRSGFQFCRRECDPVRPRADAADAPALQYLDALAAFQARSHGPPGAAA